MQVLYSHKSMNVEKNYQNRSKPYWTNALKNGEIA